MPRGRELEISEARHEGGGRSEDVFVKKDLSMVVYLPPFACAKGLMGAKSSPAFFWNISVEFGIDGSRSRP